MRTVCLYYHLGRPKAQLVSSEEADDGKIVLPGTTDSGGTRLAHFLQSAYTIIMLLTGPAWEETETQILHRWLSDPLPTDTGLSALEALAILLEVNAQ